MLLQNPLRIERRCSQVWSLVTGAVLLTAAIVLGGIGLQVDAAPPDETAEQSQEIKIKVPVRYMLSSDGEGKGYRVIVLDQKDPAQGDIIIRKDGTDAKKIFIHKVTAGQGVRPFVFAAGDSQLDPLRKALEKLEKSGSLDAEKIRAEVMKALEAIKAAPAGEKAKQQRIEIRLHIDSDGKKVHNVHVTPVPAVAPAPPVPPAVPRISPPPVAKPQVVERNVTVTVPATAQGQTTEQKVTVTVPHVDADAVRKAVEKALKSVEKPGNADELAKALEKALQGLPKKTGQNLGSPMVLAVPSTGAGAKKIDIQAVKKLVEQLEKSPGDSKVLHELLKAVSPQHGQSGTWIGDLNKFTPQSANSLMVNPYQAASSGGTSGQGRLGISVESPSSLLADQLNLPMGQGLVITDVKADSPAAKAGFKVNDILMEINKKSVSNKGSALARMIEDVKSGTAIDAVVLRKGKRETIGGITLPERSTTGASGSATSGRYLAAQALGALAPVPGKPGSSSVSTTTIRTGDKFTTRYQEGTLIISVVGNVAGGMPKVQEITIQDGAVSSKYETVDAVPAQYRDKVTYVLEISSKGEFRTESKK